MRIVLLLLCLVAACALPAATFTVTNTSNTGAGSFRQAVTDANAAAGLDTIVFNLTSLPATISLASAVTVSSPVIINGPGARSLTFTASGSGYRFLLSNNGATVEINDISISGFNGGANSGGVFGQAGTLPALTLNRVAVRNSGSNTAGMAQVNGTFVATDCEFSNITANTGANAVISCSGSLVSMTNCTITGCSAATNGGVLTMFAGTAMFTNCTITGNSTGTTGGALRVSGATSNITLRNTILAANVNGNGSGAFISSGFNLIDATTGMTITTQSTDIVGSSPNLAALANNGGPTNTMALNTGSPCIDAGDSSGSATDQRGETRPFDDTAVTNASDAADIGAFELHPATATPIIQTTGTFSNFASIGPSVVSPEQQFTVEGTGLTAPITITPPQHWEVSFTSGGTFTAFPSSISTAAPSGGVVAQTTVFVRYNPSATPPHSGSVVMSSPGATNASLAANGIQPSANATGLDFNAGEGVTPNVGSWTISLNAPLSVALTVNFTIGGGTGTGTGASTVPGDDYNLSTTAAGVTFNFIGAAGNTFTIPAGLTSFVVTLTPIDDSIVEPSETATFGIATGTGYLVGASGQQITIADNDLPAVSVAATDSTAAEGTPASDTATFTVTFSQATVVATTLNFTMSGAADTAPGVDYNLSATGGALNYSGPSGTLVVPIGTTSVTITVTCVDDTAIEGNEGLTLTLNSGSDYTVGSPASDSATIADNDALPTVTVVATDNAGSEAAAATDTATFTITLNPAPLAAVTLNFTMGGTASNGAGTDYSLSATGGTLGYTGPAGTITVAGGVTTVTVTLTVVDDAVVEGATPETAVFTLDAGTNYTVGSPASDSAAISDDDVAVTPTVTVSATDNAAAEATPATNTGEFTILLSPTPNTPLTIAFSMSGTAGATDYTLSATGGTLNYSAPNGTIDIGPGTTSIVVTLTVTDDSLAEGLTPESATITLGAGTGYGLGTSTTDTVDITDNDTPVVSVAVSDGAASETGSDTGVWTVTLSPAPTAATTLAFTMGGTADLAAGVDYTLSATGGTLAYTTGPGGTITVSAGVTTVTVTLTPVDDTLVEGATAETASFTLAAGAGYGLGTPVSGSVAISDNDVAPVDITTTSLANGTVGTLYGQPITATGGAAPYTWTIIAGVAPAGLALSGSTTSTTSLAGTPTAAGTYNFTVQVTDGVSTDTQVFTVTIAGGGSGGGGGGSSGGGGCSAQGPDVTFLLPVLGLLGWALATRRRRGA